MLVPRSNQRVGDALIRYAVFPGPVRSQMDGQWHEISARQLIMLYRVKPDECYVVPPSWPPGTSRETIAWVDSLIALRPRYSGDYTLPKELRMASDYIIDITLRVDRADSALTDQFMQVARVSPLTVGQMLQMLGLTVDSAAVISESEFYMGPHSNKLSATLRIRKEY